MNAAQQIVAIARPMDVTTARHRHLHDEADGSESYELYETLPGEDPPHTRIFGMDWK